MRFATAKEHRDFFQKKGWIEFEGLISNEQLESVNLTIDQVLSERLHVPPEKLHLLPPQQIYNQGRDLWRSHPTLRKFVTISRFAEIASELIEKKPLRLGYDQLLPAPHRTQLVNANAQVYQNFLTRTANLEDVSCLQGLACGLMVALGGQNDLLSDEVSSEEIDIFPRERGHVIFFQPHLPIKWEMIHAHAGQRFYLIVYTQAIAHYQIQSQDPHTHSLKRIGYIFNDKLNDKLNPIIYR